MRRSNPNLIYHCGTHASRVLNTIPLDGVVDVATFSEQYVNSFWYDWFCPSGQLYRRGLRLLRALKTIQHSPRFKPSEVYVWFKNNSPMTGSTYDDIRISSVETGFNLFVIQIPSNRYGEKHGWEVCSRESHYETVASGKLKDIQNWFMHPALLALDGITTC